MKFTIPTGRLSSRLRFGLRPRCHLQVLVVGGFCLFGTLDITCKGGEGWYVIRVLRAIEVLLVELLLFALSSR